MPRSAGAGPVRNTSRWDPGRRPSSRVSSTSGALGSSLLRGSLPGSDTADLFVSYPGRSGPQNRRTPQLGPLGARPLDVLASSQAGPELLMHEARDEPRDVAAEGGNLLHQGGRDEAALGPGRDEDGLHTGQGPVHLRHLQLVVEVAGGPQALDDRRGLVLGAEGR